MVRTKRAQVSIALICLILGIMCAVQYRGTTFYKTSLVPPRIEDLTVQLKNITGERDVVEQKVVALNQRLEDIRNSDQLMADLQKELQLVNMAGGLYPMEGPGISLTITNSPESFQTEGSNSGSFAEANDLLVLTNELKASGAEAISINEQRIAAMSEICWTGTMVVVNGNQISPPYHIQAIGDSNNLESGVSLAGGYLYYLKFQRHIDLKKVDHIKMPAFNGYTQMSYGRPGN